MFVSHLFSNILEYLLRFFRSGSGYRVYIDLNMN